MIAQISPTHQFTFDGVMLNVYHADAKQGLTRHSHTYAHATVCHAGRCAIRKENVYVELTKESQPVTLRANEWHEIEALEDGTVFCNVFSEGKY